MLKNLTVPEFEAIVASRALCERLIDRRTGGFLRGFSYNKGLVAATFAANSVFKDLGIDKEIWCWMRGKRAFVFHVKSNRILAQLGVDVETISPYANRSLRVVLLDRRGYIRQSSINSLVEYASRAKYGSRGQERTKHANFNQTRQRRPIPR